MMNGLNTVPYQHMHSMLMTTFPTAETCSPFIDELVVALFKEEILSSDQVALKIASVLKPLVSTALNTQWLQKYKLTIHTPTGAPLKGTRKGSKTKMGQNLIRMLEDISPSESFFMY